MSEVKSDRYLFKAKRLDNNAWVIGHYTYYHSSRYGLIHAILLNINGKTKRYPIDVKTLCQCTGITDMTDKLIFEDDTISMDSWNPKEMWVRFIEGAFCLCFLEGKNKGEYCADIHYVQHAGRKQATIIKSIHD